MTNQIPINSQEPLISDQEIQNNLNREQLKLLEIQIKEAQNKVILGSLINFLISGFIVLCSLYFIFFLFGAIESNSVGLTKVGSGFMIGLLLSLLTYINNYKFSDMNKDAQIRYEQGNTLIAGQLALLVSAIPEIKADLKSFRAEMNTEFEKQASSTKSEFEKQASSTKSEFEKQAASTKSEFEKQDSNSPFATQT